MEVNRTVGLQEFDTPGIFYKTENKRALDEVDIYLQYIVGSKTFFFQMSSIVEQSSTLLHMLLERDYPFISKLLAHFFDSVLY